MREIRLICKKELSRVLTDRKMLFSIFLLPAIIMVVVMNVMTSFSENLENDVKSHAPIVYLQSAPKGVEQYLKAYNEKMDLRTMDDEQKVTEEIRDGSADLWIAFPQDFLEQIEVYKTGDEIPQIKVYYNPSEEYSQAAYEGVAGGCLEVYRQALLSERVGDMQSLTVFTVNSDNPDMVIQDEQKAGGKALGMMLPYFVTILLFAGAMGLGTDMVAGEKERGTMASMLVAPIKRSSIVLGKVFALMIISGISSVVYVAVMVGFLPQMMGAYGSEGLGLSLEVRQSQMLPVLKAPGPSCLYCSVSASPDTGFHHKRSSIYRFAYGYSRIFFSSDINVLTSLNSLYTDAKRTYATGSRSLRRSITISPINLLGISLSSLLNIWSSISSIVCWICCAETGRL